MAKSKVKAYWIRKIADYTGVVFLGMALLFIWQIYREPIALPFLKPYIIKALNHDDTEYQVTLDSVNLEFVRSIKPIKIIANNVVYKKNNGAFSVMAPRTSVSFSIKAILRGIVAPSSIEVENPSIHIFTEYGVEKETQKEEVTRKKLEYYVDGFEGFLERFNSDEYIYAESYINDISIKNAEVEFHEVDLGRKWAFSDLNYTFERNADNIETEFSGLIKNKDTIASVGVEAQYRPAQKKMALRVYFNDFIPADFVETYLNEDVKEKIYQANIPLDGNIEAMINYEEISKNKSEIIKSLDTAIENVKFQFEGSNGNIMFSDDEEYKYDISAFMLEGTLDSGLNNLKIENADFNLGTQKTRLSLYVSGMKDYLIKNSLKDLKVSLKAEIDRLAIDDLPQYWPKYISELAWQWVEESLSGGQAENASFTFDFAYDPKAKSLAFTNLSGQTGIADSSLFYLSGMPVIKNLYGTAHFYNDSIVIDVDKGLSEGIELTGGSVKLYDLDKKDNFADIHLIMASSITDALRMIDNKPLGYAKEMGLKPEDFQGRAETDLRLNFELKQNLKPEEVKADVKSLLTNVLIPNVVQGKSLKADKLDLEVTNKGLIVSGEAELDGVKMGLNWNEGFDSKEYKSKYNLTIKLDEDVKKKFGIDSEILAAPYIKGHADVVADVIIYNDNKTKIDLTASLKDADIDYSFLGFRKPLGEEATIKTGMIFEKDKLKSISDFHLTKSDFQIDGKVILDEQSKIKTVDIYTIKGPKTDARAKLDFTHSPKAKININVSGDSYDLTEFFVGKEKEFKAEPAAQVSEKEKDSFEDVTDTDVFIEVNNLWTNPDVPIKNVTVSANLLKGIGVNELHMFGNFSSRRDVTLKLDYTPRPNGEFILTIQSNDAGNTLRVLRIYENMHGGELNISAKRNADKEFVGHAMIRNFSIHGTPVLAKVLTLASFTGMVNMLTGEGMAFSHFDAPFEYRNKVLFIKDSRAFGNVMGITADGHYNRRDDSLKIKGLIAPAYGLNTLIGKIPLVGSLLSGKDGTVFAASYSIRGSVSNPEVDIDTLSALSPNSLKELLTDAFGSSDEYK